MTKIIAAIDNSLAAKPVLMMSTALAEVLGADVEALHVSDDGQHTASDSAESHGVTFRQLPGDPLARITEQATNDEVVMIAIGARNRRSGRHVGHLAQQVADAIDKPVLVVPPGAEPPAHLRRVVIAMEGSGKRSRHIKSVIDLTAGSELELVVVHVDDEDTIPSFSDQLAYEADAYAREFLARYAPGARHSRLELRVGMPTDEILDVAEAATADLLVIGWHQSATGDRGAVARELLERCRIPVLLVALDTDRETRQDLEPSKP